MGQKIIVMVVARSGRLPGGGDTRWGLAARPKAADAHSRPLQELLLLLPVGVHHLLGHQLHQLQAFLDLQQDLKVLPAPHLSTGGRPRPRGTGPSAPDPQREPQRTLGSQLRGLPSTLRPLLSSFPGGAQVFPAHTTVPTPSCP